MAIGVGLIIFNRRSKKKVDGGLTFPSALGKVKSACVHESINHDESDHQTLSNYPAVEYTYEINDLVYINKRPSYGFPWQGYYVTANGDLTVDLRSNIAAESRAKVVYEYLLQFTDDPDVHRTLRFLMTREITHFQQFTAALNDIQPNFPPAIRQGDPRYTHLAFNYSGPDSQRGPWNKGQGPWDKGEEWVYVEEPISYVDETQGLVEQPAQGTTKKQNDVTRKNKELSKKRSEEIKKAVESSKMQWSQYDDPNQKNSSTKSSNKK
mgnify:CR=1 FL=1|jgi:Mn-containing catalase